jgi:hypothetical protein
MTGFQIALARAALGLNQQELAKYCGLVPSTILKLERSRLGALRGSAASLEKVVNFLGQCGVGLMPDGLSIGLSNPRVPWPARPRLSAWHGGQEPGARKCDTWIEEKNLVLSEKGLRLAP